MVGSLCRLHIAVVSLVVEYRFQGRQASGVAGRWVQ